jgi:hypothetical protein
MTHGRALAITVGIVSAALAGLAALALFLWISTSAPARERFAGEFDKVPDNIRSWFKSVRSPRGVPCCDVADGHRTTWRSGDEDAENSGYEVPITDTHGTAPDLDDPDAAGIETTTTWVKVPKAAVVHNAGNPTGESIVWYVRQRNNDYFIRCFVSGNDG